MNLLSKQVLFDFSTLIGEKSKETNKWSLFFLPLKVGSIQIHGFRVLKSAFLFFPVFLKPLLIVPYHI